MILFRELFLDSKQGWKDSWPALLSGNMRALIKFLTVNGLFLSHSIWELSLEYLMAGDDSVAWIIWRLLYSRTLSLGGNIMRAGMANERVAPLWSLVSSQDGELRMAGLALQHFRAPSVHFPSKLGGNCISLCDPLLVVI